MKTIPDIFVTGTDTGVGKSVVSLLLMQLLYAEGYAPFYVKPFQTGCKDPYDRDSDAAFVYGRTRELRNRDPARSVIHCFPNPKAPYFAARDAGREVSLKQVAEAVRQARQSHAPVIVEGAGGLMVPVTFDLTMMDIIESIQCKPLLVACAGLGTINHTLLSAQAMERRKIQPLGVVLVESSPEHTDTAMVAENMEAIKNFSGLKVGGVIPFLSDLFEPPLSAYGALKNILF